jgi:hypothetical protein
LYWFRGHSNLLIRQPNPLLWWGGIEFQFGAKALVFVKQSPEIKFVFCRLLIRLWTAMTAPGAVNHQFAVGHNGHLPQNGQLTMMVRIGLPQRKQV